MIVCRSYVLRKISYVITRRFGVGNLGVVWSFMTSSETRSILDRWCLTDRRKTRPHESHIAAKAVSQQTCIVGGCWGKFIIPYLCYKHKSSLAQNLRDVTSIYNYSITERGLYQIRKKEKEKDELTSHRSSWDTTQVSFDVMVFCTLFYHKEETKDWEYQY